MKISRIQTHIIDLIVPFGPLLRRVDEAKPFVAWPRVLLSTVPRTFFIFWLFSLIPFGGSLLYFLFFVPLSAWQHIRLKNITEHDKIPIYLWYFVVVVIGFGGLWGFIGHTFLADMVATNIGWQTGSPFQTELAFYHLGLSVAGILAIWLRGHMITALVISKSIFWYGAAFVHIKDAIVNQNYAPLNVGSILVADIVFPTVFLAMLIVMLKHELTTSAKNK